MLTWRRAVDVTLGVGLFVLFIFVPWLHDHRSALLLAYLAVSVTVGFVRGKPGTRFLIVSLLVPVVAIALAVLALWINVWLGLAFIVVVPTTALIVAYRRDERAAVMNDPPRWSNNARASQRG